MVNSDNILTNENACGLEGGKSKDGMSNSILGGGFKDPMTGAFGTEADT